VDELEEMFTSVEKKIDPGAEKKEKKKVAQLIDPRRSQNLSIFLQTLKRSPYELKGDILSVNWEVLNLEVTKQLRMYVPAKDELALIHEWRESNSQKPPEEQLELPAAETFMDVVGDVEMLAERLQIVETRLQHALLLEQVQSDISCLERGLNEIKHSKRLEKIMELVLHIGNYINSGTHRGKCDGFKLSTLRRLADFRSKKNPKMNLLLFLFSFLSKSFPDLLQLEEMGESVKEASKINTGFVGSSINSLCSGMDFIKKALPKFSNQTDKCVELMSPWVEGNEETLASVVKYWERVQQIHKDLCVRLGEDPKSFDAQELCEGVTAFVQQLSAVKLVLEREAERKEAERKREEAKKKKAEEKEAKEAIPDDAVVDDIFENIKAGRLGGRRRRGDRKKIEGLEEEKEEVTLTIARRKRRNWGEETEEGSGISRRDREKRGSTLESRKRRRDLLEAAEAAVGKKEDEEEKSEEKEEEEKEEKEEEKGETPAPPPRAGRHAHTDDPSARAKSHYSSALAMCPASRLLEVKPLSGRLTNDPRPVLHFTLQNPVLTHFGILVKHDRTVGGSSQVKKIIVRAVGCPPSSVNGGGDGNGSDAGASGPPSAPRRRNAPGTESSVQQQQQPSKAIKALGMYTIPRTEANTLLTFPLPRPNSPEFSLGQPFEFSSLVIESLQNYGAARTMAPHVILYTTP